jgi:choice-of-anchor B domain-containing protein
MGNEYALVGTLTGISIINVTNPNTPTLVVDVTGPTSDWREIKTFGNFAYVVTEGSSGTNVGLTIINLSFLPNLNVNDPNQVHAYRGDGAILNQLSRVHALHVDETAGYLYLYGSSLNGGRPLMFNLNVDPYNPTYAGFVNTNFTGSNYNYVHDGYVDNNMLYAGNIYGGFFSIVNTTDKANPVLIATQNTPNNFTHNTWLNGSVLFTTDERDNSFLAGYDVSDPDNIRFLDKIQSNPGGNAIVHNTYIINNYAVTSWYKDGFTIVDVSRPSNLVQVGDYDTYPAEGGGGYGGCWGVYPYLPSGNIIASNINDVPFSSTGKLFVFTPNYVRGCYLEGIVTDAVSGNPINGAMVQILSTPAQEESSTANGSYKMGRVDGGVFTVEVSKINYQTYTTTATLTNGVLTTLDIPLQPLVLPVELIGFQARPEGTSALLDWATASERDNAGFEIQHSTDGISWEVKGFANARNDGQYPARYGFEVKGLTPGVHFFRLRQVDTDGRSDLSSIESISIEGSKIHALIVPTVAYDQCELRIKTDTPASVRVEIFRADGQSTGLIWTLQAENEHILPLPVQNLAAGAYFASILTAGERATVSFSRK